MSIKQKTVFVLGAGASKELDLPTGDELKEKIARELDIRFSDGYSQVSGNQTITNVFRLLTRQEQRRDINSYLHTCWKIRDAMPQAISIDNFIDARSDDPFVEVAGKLGISASVLAAESGSKLKVASFKRNEGINFKALANTWHNSFFQLLTENCKKVDLRERLKKVALIIFNYDRCVEVFLLQALQNYYTIDEPEALELLKEVEIHHPYGVVGALPGLGAGTAAAFGATVQAEQLLQISREIKTFTEGTDNSASHIRRIRELMSKCHRIVFLGFAYHQLNMQLLFNTPSGLPPLGSRKIYGTALGLSDSDKTIVTEELSQYAETPVDCVQLRNDLTCSQLFKDYWRSMSIQ